MVWSYGININGLKTRYRRVLSGVVNLVARARSAAQFAKHFVDGQRNGGQI